MLTTASSFFHSTLPTAALLVLLAACSSQIPTEESPAVPGTGGAAGENSDASGGAPAQETQKEDSKEEALPDFSDAPPLPLNELCDTYVQDLCSYQIECSSLLYQDQAHCESQTECFGFAHLTEAVDSGALDYDAKAAGECQALFEYRGCDAYLSLYSPDIYKLFGNCAGVLTGKVADGAACLDDIECTSGICDETAGTCPGQCVPVPAQGEPCAAWRRCAEGDRCDSSDVCQPPLEHGDACDDKRCGNTLVFLDGRPEDYRSLYCETSHDVCQNSPLLGEECGYRSTSTGSYIISCDQGWCNALGLFGSGVCVPLNGEDGECGQSGGCEPDLNCVGASSLSMGTCVSPGKEGESCSAIAKCEEGLVCHSGVCSSPLMMGEDCVDNTDCESEFCHESVCTQPLFPGDACGEGGGQCAHSLCVENECAPLLMLGQACEEHEQCASGSCMGGSCLDGLSCAP